jgi:NitT/TauT family transport system permease protein
MSTVAATVPARPVPAVLRRVASLLLNFAGPLAIAAVVWELVSRAGIVDEAIFPPFSAVIVSTAELLTQGGVYVDLGASLYRALAGLTLGALSGTLLGIVMARSRPLRKVVYPLVALTYTLPKTALIPITLLWLGVGDTSTILVVYLSTFVPLVISAYHGAESVPAQYFWSAESMGTSRLRVLTTVVVPASLPYILNGLRIALAFSFVVVISAEMIAAFSGIGKLIFVYGESGNYTFMFAAILIVVAVAFLLDRVLAALSRRLLIWSESEAQNG